MSEKKGIESTKLVVLFAAEAANVGDEVFRGGSIIKKIGAAGKLLDEVIALKDFKPEELRLEFSDLDAEERKELVKVFSDKFDLQNDFAELLVERSLDLVMNEGLIFAKKAKAIADILKDGKAVTLAKEEIAKEAKEPKAPAEPK